MKLRYGTRYRYNTIPIRGIFKNFQSDTVAIRYLKVKFKYINTQYIIMRNKFGYANAKLTYYKCPKLKWGLSH
jgi:hypothetical protein